MERCDHRDGYGSTIMPDRLCLLCERTIPITVREALSLLVATIKATLRR